MSPTKQAKPMATKGGKGNSEEPKLQLGGRMEKKNLGELRLNQGTSCPLTNEPKVYDHDSDSIIGQKSDWFGPIRILSSSIWFKIRVITPVWRQVC